MNRLSLSSNPVYVCRGISKHNMLSGCTKGIAKQIQIVLHRALIPGGFPDVCIASFNQNINVI